MRKRLIYQIMLITILFYKPMICPAAESPESTDPNRYLNAVREFANNVLNLS